MKPRRVLLAAGLVIAALGLIEAWAQRFYIHPDSLQYIDIADAYARGDLRVAVNASWSPLLSWLYVPFVRWLPRRGEWAVFHLLNVALLLFTYWGFVRLLRIAARRHAAALSTTGLVIATAVFAWTQLQLVRMHFLSGDRLAAGLFFLALSCLLDDDPHHARRNAALGAGLLGLAYLAKAIYLPIAIVMLPLLLLRSRHSVSRLLLAYAILALVAAPWMLVLSAQKHRFTYSDAGRLNYLWDINGVPRYMYQGSPQQHLLHPPRIVSEQPRFYEFDAPFHVTYGLHYDPSYWFEGAQPRLQAGAIARNAAHNVVQLVQLLWPLIAIAALMLVLSVKRRVDANSLVLAVCGAVGLAAYCVLHVEPRYIAPFAALLVIPLVLSLELAVSRTRRDLPAFAILAAAVWCYPLYSLGLDALAIAGYDRRFAPYRDNPAIVQALRAAGVRSGTRIATVGPDFFAHNARVLNARIVAASTAQDTAAFWAAPASTREQAFRALRGAGVDVVVGSHAAPGWQPLAAGFYLKRLR